MPKQFRTEKEIEELLELETRVIPWLNGEMKAYTDFKLFWCNYDLLLECTDWTPERVIEIAEESQREGGHSFEENLQTVVGYISAKLKDAYYGE